MANITTPVTLADLAKLQSPDGSPIPGIVNMLAETNEILDDMLWKPTNKDTSELLSVLNGIPEPTWRRLNYGVKRSKGEYTQVEDTCAMLEARSEIDQKMFAVNSAAPEFRIQEARAKLEGFNQAVANGLFYADQKKTPEKITGLAPRFSVKSTDKTKSGFNIIDAGGSSNLTSVYMVVWGPMSAYGIVPKNSTAGFTHKDLGEYDATDDDGGKYRVVGDLFQWDLGLCVRDWRYIVRIANVDVSALKKDAASGADLIDLMTQAEEQVPSLGMGRPVFYCTKTVRSYLRRQIRNAKNVQISMDQVAGKRVTSFDGIPVRRVDQISESETKVS